MGEVKWLEDDPIPEWAEYQGDRWTNVYVGPIHFRVDSIFNYDPSGSPLMRVLGSNYTQLVRCKSTKRERFLYWIQRRRRAVALLVDPTLEDDLERDLW